MHDWKDVIDVCANNDLETAYINFHQTFIKYFNETFPLKKRIFARILLSNPGLICTH